MRFALAGTLPEPKPLILKYMADGSIDIPTYIALGYTNFDAICIGAGGGRGGGYDGADYNTPANKLRSYGGEGGGGGFHRVKGVLASLDDTVGIVVGTPGANGDDLLTDSTDEYDIATTDGDDGGNSQFGISCIASGGNGGKRVYSATLTISLNCSGGDGGLGGIGEHGWGGAGGTAGTFADLGPEPGTPGENGPLFKGPFEYTAGFVTASGLIGKGGGGGAGGLGLYGASGAPGTNRLEATAGGRGAYDPGDESVYGPGGAPGHDPDSNTNDVIPGYAGGARVTPLDGTRIVYGTSGRPGVVVIRLTAEE